MVKRPDSVSILSVEQVKKMGLIQEINRRLLHPIGIAMQTVGVPGQPLHLVFSDYRHVEGGVRLGNEDPDKAHELATAVDDLLIEVSGPRKKKYGWVIQPPNTTGLRSGTYPGED